MNGTLNTVDGRPALRFERRLAHPVERVWRAVSEPPELSQWFVAPVPWKPESGETFEAHGQRGEVLDLEAPSVLAWSWAGELFRFELSADGDGCLLVFTHVFDDPPWARSTRPVGTGTWTVLARTSRGAISRRSRPTKALRSATRATRSSSLRVAGRLRR
jgi:uncharacterized protein YndB with AHSA1/START domain